MKVCRPGSPANVALLLRALLFATLTPYSLAEDLDGTSTYASLSAGDLTHVFMYTGEDKGLSSSTVPEEGDLLVLARFPPIIWMVETVEHANAVHLATLDAQPHRLYDDETAEWASGEPGYWVTYEGEETFARAKALAGKEGGLLAQQRRSEEEAKAKAQRDATWERDRAEQMRRHANIVRGSAERQREQREQHDRAEREEERQHDEETAPSWLADKPFTQLSAAGDRSVYLYVKQTDERPGLGSLVTLSAEWSAANANTENAPALDTTQDEEHVWLVMTIEHETAVKLQLVSALRHGLDADFDSSRGGVWEYYTPPPNKLPPYLPASHPLLQPGGDPGASKAKANLNELRGTLVTGRSNKLLYVRVEKDSTSAAKLPVVNAFISIFGGLEVQNHTPSSCGNQDGRAQCDNMHWQVLSSHETYTHDVLTLKIVSHDVHGLPLSHIPQSTHGIQISWTEMNDFHTPPPFTESAAFPGNDVSRDQLAQFYSEMGDMKMPWEVDDVLNMMSDTQIIGGLSKKYGRTLSVKQSCQYPLLILRSGGADAKHPHVMIDDSDSVYSMFKTGATVSDAMLRQFYAQYDAAKVDRVTEFIQSLTTSQLVQGLLRKYGATVWPGKPCKYPIVEASAGDNDNDNHHHDEPQQQHHHNQAGQQPTGQEQQDKCRYPTVYVNRDCESPQKCADRLQAFFPDGSLPLEQLTEFYAKHDPTKAAQASQFLEIFTTWQLVAGLLRKYQVGPIPGASRTDCLESEVVTNGSVSQSRLRYFYEVMDASKVDNVSQILQFYTTKEIVQGMREKYGMWPRPGSPTNNDIVFANVLAQQRWTQAEVEREARHKQHEHEASEHERRERERLEHEREHERTVKAQMERERKAEMMEHNREMAEKQRETERRHAQHGSATGIGISREQLIEFYAAHEPSKVHMVDQILAEYTMDSLIEGLGKKYGQYPVPGGAPGETQAWHGSRHAANEAHSDAGTVSEEDAVSEEDFASPEVTDLVHQAATALQASKRGSCVRQCASNHLKDAKRLLTDALMLATDSDKYRLLYKRYAVCLRQRKYKDALADLTGALKINSEYSVALLDRAKLLKLLGRCSLAREDTSKLEQLASNGRMNSRADAIYSLRHSVEECISKMKFVEEMVAQNNYYQMKVGAEEALQYATYSMKLIMVKARAHVELEETHDALQATAQALKLEPESIEALQLRGEVYYALDDNKLAMRHFRQALRLDPEHKACKKLYRKLKKVNKAKARAEKLEQEGNYIEAALALEELLGLETAWNKQNALKRRVRLKQAQIYSAVGEHAKVIDTCNDLMLLEENAECYNLMGASYEARSLWEEAQRNYQQALNFDPNNMEYMHNFERAQQQVHRMNRVNWYEILGIQPHEYNRRVIKRAYKKMALKWHPDKHQNADALQKKKAKEMFMKVGEAFEIISDDELRSRYDNGEDHPKKRRF